MLVQTPDLQQIIINLYQRLYHCGESLETVREEILPLRHDYPLLQCFESFFSRSTRGISR